MLKPAAIALAALLLAAPAQAQKRDALLVAARDFGSGLVSEIVRAGAGGDDRLLMLGRQQGQVVVTGLATARASEWPSLPAGTRAVLRSRTVAANGNRAPGPADFAFVRRTGIRLFVVGAWTEPPPLWEIARIDREIRFREIDADSLPGPWQTPP